MPPGLLLSAFAMLSSPAVNIHQHRQSWPDMQFQHELHWLNFRAEQLL